MRTAHPTTLHDAALRYSAAQRRTVAVALDLFSRHGVGGTSLQMIADALGVTKAAVYHQFPTKDAIVLAVIEVQLRPVEAIVERAEASRPSAETREALLAAIVDEVVTHRRSLSTLQSDPVLFRLLGEHPPSLQMWTRLFSVLLGDDVDDRAQVRAAALSAAFGAVAYPFVVDLDDDVLRTELLRLTTRLLVDAD